MRTNNKKLLKYKKKIYFKQDVSREMERTNQNKAWKINNSTFIMWPKIWLKKTRSDHGVVWYFTGFETSIQ